VDQKLELQLKVLKKAGCQKIFREKVSGFNRQRPEFQRLLDQIRPGDVIVVWKLDRLAAPRDLLNTMETINEVGGKFQSISEPWANTTTQAGKMIMTVFAGIAEFERDLIRERTGAGRVAAKQRAPALVAQGNLVPIRQRLPRNYSRKARPYEISQGRLKYIMRRFIAWLLLRDF